MYTTSLHVPHEKLLVKQRTKQHCHIIPMDTNYWEVTVRSINKYMCEIKGQDMRLSELLHLYMHN